MKDVAWNHVTVLSEYGGGGGSKRWQCNYCGLQRGGAATRIKDHLSGVPNKDIGPCDNVPADVKASLESWRRGRLVLPGASSTGEASISDDVASATVGPSKRTRVATDTDTATGIGGESQTIPSTGPAHRTPLPGSTSTSTSSARRGAWPAAGVAAAKGSLQQASMQASFQKQAIAEATRELTRLFIQCAISFHVLRTPVWKSAMRAVSRIGCEWEGPSCDGMRVRELKNEKIRIEAQLEPLKATWVKYGCTILCDGWSDVRRRNVYNILVSSCKGTMFLRAIDASAPGTVVTGAFIWQHIRQAIEEIGSDNVVQVVTDNGSNCVSMGRMLEDAFPKIRWTPCASHSLDLLMEDLEGLAWVADIFSRAKSMVKFVTKRPKVLSIYRAHSDLELLKPSSTRFAYMFIVVERLVRVRKGLMRTVVSREWSDLDEHQHANYMAFSRNVMDEAWWQDAEAFVKSIKPVYSVLRITDMEGSTMGLLYEYMDKIGEAFQNNTFLSRSRIEELQGVWNTRWDWFHRPIHAVAHVLHPLWRSEHQYENEELEQGIQEYFEQWAGGDLQVMRRLEDDLLVFRNKSNSFGRHTAELRETQLQPVSWWEKYGTSAPTLKRLAIRVLSQDCSSGPCERNWSTWALFHTKKRNRLSTAQLERLVFCHCNLRLLEHTSTSPEPRQVNVDKVDIEKVHDIPDIPREEMDIYTMLYEEMSAPANRTRASSRRSRSARGAAIAGTSTVAIASASPSSSSADEHSESSVSEDGSDADVHY